MKIAHYENTSCWVLPDTDLALRRKSGIDHFNPYFDPYVVFKYPKKGQADRIQGLRWDVISICNAYSANPQISPIKKITVVGATVMPGLDLLCRDKAFIKEAVTGLARKGVATNRKFKMTTMNLALDERGDFLKHAPASDLIVVCYVANDPNISIDTKDDRLREIWGKAATAKSTRHYETRSWENAATQAGARFVVVFGGHREINETQFVGHTESPFDYIASESVDMWYLQTDCHILAHRDVTPLLRRDSNPKKDY